MFRAVRRVWVTVLIGVLGLVVGLMIGFTVGRLHRSVDPTWLEALGTGPAQVSPRLLWFLP